MTKFQMNLTGLTRDLDRNLVGQGARTSMFRGRYRGSNKIKTSTNKRRRTIVRKMKTINRSITTVNIKGVTVISGTRAINVRQILILRGRQRIKANRARVPSNATDQFAYRYIGHTIDTHNSNKLMSFHTNFQDKHATITRMQHQHKVHRLNRAPTVIISLKRFTRVLSVTLARRNIGTRIRPYHHMSRWSTRDRVACPDRVSAYNRHCERSL